MGIYPQLLKIDITSICVRDSKEPPQWKDTGDWGFPQRRAGLGTDRKKGEGSKSGHGPTTD